MAASLPDDVLTRVFECFDTSTDAYTACQVSRHWAYLLQRRCPALWRTMRVSVTDGVCLDRSMVTRAKRKRYTLFLTPLLTIKGAFLHNLTIGMQNNWCDLPLSAKHLDVIATTCPHLQKLKLYVTDVVPELRLSAINHLIDSCPQLTTLALPVNGATAITNVLPTPNMRIEKLRLHGEWTLRAPVWLGQSLVTLQLVDVCDVDNCLLELYVLEHCTRLQHLIIHNCSSRANHPVHLLDPASEERTWVHKLAAQLLTLAVVRSSTLICTASLLTCFAAYGDNSNTPDSHVPFRNLRDLWLDAQIFPGENYETERLFSCLECTRYFIYKRTTATEVIRCSACRQQKFSMLEAVYLVE